MKTIFEHIEYIQGKPHHIRKKVAYATAGGVAALVALVWFFGTLSSGAFAIQGSTFAQSTGGDPATTTDTGIVDGGTDSGIAGVAASLPQSQTQAHIEIIDSSTSTSSEKPVEPTVIPF